MGKLFKSKDILLLGLANLLDTAEEFKDPFHLISSSYKSMYGWVPKQYKKHNFYQLISRSYKAKFIEKIEKGGKIYIRITSDGHKTIQRDFPLFSLQNKRWDRKWRIVMFDIEEVNKQMRDRLRLKLKELGFGMLQESVFISPHDILQDFIEFAEASEVKDYLYILETYRIILGDEREFANKIWKLDDLNEKYKNIVDLILNSGRGKKSDTRNIRDIRSNWLRIVSGDPFLPKELLPKPWYGNEAEKLVKKLTL